MGIKNLTKLLRENAPGCIKEDELKNYFGRKVAIDASMALYQFLIAIQTDAESLTDASGETTSHLAGMFYRTIRLCNLGLKPVYVFDGKPPEMKSDELVKRREKNQEAQESLAKAKEEGDAEMINKLSKRTVRVSSTHRDEAMKLLDLLGVPYVLAPCEAEAQCASLAKDGKVWATATEDMDALTFGTPTLLRHLTFSESRKLPVLQINLDNAIKELGLTMDQFIDMCILCGCDYCGTIRGIGPMKSLDLIKKHKNIETVIKNLDTEKYPVPDSFNYEQARKLFKEHEVTKSEDIELTWKPPQEKELIEFMCGQKGFSVERVTSGMNKIKASQAKKTQNRMTDFFKVTGVTKVKADPKAKTAIKAKGKTLKGAAAKRFNKK